MNNLRQKERHTESGDQEARQRVGEDMAVHLLKYVKAQVQETT